MKDDTISRQAVLNLIEQSCCDLEYACDNVALRKEVEALPSAQPERKRGRWIYGEDEHGIDGYCCDKCGFFVPWDYTHKFIDFIKDYHFCPNCGADMRGEQDVKADKSASH